MNATTQAGRTDGIAQVTTSRGARRRLGRPERGTKRDQAFGYLMLGPASVVSAIFLVFPLILLAIISAKATQLGTIAKVFSAAWTPDHLLAIVKDPTARHSLLVSVEYVAGATLGGLLLGLGTGLLLNRHFPGRRIFRTLILLPWAVPGVTATVGFLWIASPSFGVLNYVLRQVGLIHTDVNWFGNHGTAMLAVLAPTIWKSYPFFTIIVLAALQSIPREFYEAAAVDGAGGWQQFRFITWPFLRRYLVIASAFSAMWAFQSFDFIFASTQGGPGRTTNTVAMEIFNRAFKSFKFADAASLGLVTFVIVAVLVIFLLPWQLPSQKKGGRR